MNGRKRSKLRSPRTQLIHPVAVYMFHWILVLALLTAASTLSVTITVVELVASLVSSDMATASAVWMAAAGKKYGNFIITCKLVKEKFGIVPVAINKNERLMQQ